MDSEGEASLKVAWLPQHPTTALRRLRVEDGSASAM